MFRKYSNALRYKHLTPASPSNTSLESRNLQGFYSDFTHIMQFDFLLLELPKGPFKYYVIKEVGGWGQKMAIFEYCKSSKRWVGLKKS